MFWIVYRQGEDIPNCLIYDDYQFDEDQCD